MIQHAQCEKIKRRQGIQGQRRSVKERRKSFEKEKSYYGKDIIRFRMKPIYQKGLNMGIKQIGRGGGGAIGN